MSLTCFEGDDFEITCHLHQQPVVGAERHLARTHTCHLPTRSTSATRPLPRFFSSKTRRCRAAPCKARLTASWRSLEVAVRVLEEASAAFVSSSTRTALAASGQCNPVMRTSVRYLKTAAATTQLTTAPTPPRRAPTQWRVTKHRSTSSLRRRLRSSSTSCFVRSHCTRRRATVASARAARLPCAGRLARSTACPSSAHASSPSRATQRLVSVVSRATVLFCDNSMRRSIRTEIP